MKVLIQLFENSKVRDINNFPELHEEIQRIFQLEFNTYFLQKFDRDFNTFVDIDNELDLVDKDRIKVILKQPQVIPIVQENFTSSLTFSSQPIDEVPETQEIVTLPLRMKQWPSQIVLPVENFSTILREELNAKKLLSWDVSRELVGHLANYAYSFKPYPNKMERLEVCHALVQIYPHLRNEIGIGIHGWEIKLLNKLKKIRQGDTSLEVQLNRLNSKIDGSKVPKNLNINPKKGELNWAPDHVPGENERSVALHKTNLKNEAAKSENHQDKSKISALMSLTYSFRRQDINDKILVRILKEEYPLFFQRNQQLEEFERLTAVAIKEVFFQESKNQGRILYKLFGKKKKTDKETLLLKNFIAECEDLEAIKVIEAKISFGFFLLPYLLKDDVECLIKIVPDGDSTPEYGVFAKAYPKILVSGSLLEGSYSIICEDVELTICKDFLDSVCLLISYYYTLNIQFPPEASNTLAFLQFSVLKIHSGRIPPRMKTLMRKVTSIQEDSV